MIHCKNCGGFMPESQEEYDAMDNNTKVCLCRDGKTGNRVYCPVCLTRMYELSRGYAWVCEAPECKLTGTIWELQRKRG